MEYDVAVLGGGPAGMMAAIRASHCGAKVILLEKNDELGKKLLITGNGRCNITNTLPSIREFLSDFGRKGKFLYPSFKALSNLETVEFFNTLGLETKLEDGIRVFPVTDDARDVRDTLSQAMREHGVDIVYNAQIEGFSREGERVYLKAKGKDIVADRYILCTGGMSYPLTGSTGEGMEWAKDVGHKLITPKPALVHIEASDKWLQDLNGLSFSNLNISVFQDGKKKHRTNGDILFTYTGVTGPAIISMSKNIGELLKDGVVELHVDLKPELNHPQLGSMLQKEFESHSKKNLLNVLSGVVPSRLAKVILDITDLDIAKNAGNVSKEERKLMVNTLKQFTLCVRTLGSFERAIITAGGVDLKEVDPNTLQSKILENLYFAGEVLDIDGPTGGYNLQVAWSTGYLAGESAAKK